MQLTMLASGLSYSRDAGAAGLVTAASLNPGNGTTSSYAASYDDDLRLLSSSLSASGSTLYQVQPGYDAASNVIHVTTTLPGGTGNVTDNQSFCYDEQNRLTWASSQTASGPDVPGTSTPCASNTAGTLTGGSALYTASYSYDNLDRLTSGPAGAAYTYGASAHLHAATSTSGGYSASYDAAGNMVCRAPTTSTTCSGSSPTGAGLSYDNEGQLVGWTSALTGQPTPSTASFAYDGEGSRVAQQTTTGGGVGITTMTDYLLGGLEEVSSSGGSSTLTEYYPIPGIGTAVRVNTSTSSTLSYLASDQLGSVSVALSTSGTVTAQALYSPYGSVRFSSGTMPTAHGYTGQLADAITGLDDYGARYYDPALGEFTSADSEIEGGLDRYAYVGDSPCTYNDPSGHCAHTPRNRLPGWKNALYEALTALSLLFPWLHFPWNQPDMSGSNRTGTGVTEQQMPDKPAQSVLSGSGGPCGGDGGPGKGRTRTIGVGGLDDGSADETGQDSAPQQHRPYYRGYTNYPGEPKGQAPGQGSSQGNGTSSYTSIVPDKGWYRWNANQTRQDQQSDLAQAQFDHDSRLERINSYDPPPASPWNCIQAMDASGCGGGSPPVFGQQPNVGQQPAQNPGSSPSEPDVPPIEIPPIAAWLLQRELSML